MENIHQIDRQNEFDEFLGNDAWILGPKKCEKLLNLLATSWVKQFTEKKQSRAAEVEFSISSLKTSLLLFKLQIFI